MQLIPDLLPEQIQERKKEQKQELKFLGSGRKKRGQTLFGFNHTNGQIYKVKIENKVTFDITKQKEKSSMKALINSNHYLIWALNEKNARRKFNKILTIANHAKK